MSIFDRVTRAVGDVVDRGKKEVDQFVKIQKINGQIADIEKDIVECRGQIQQTKLRMGEMVIGMLRAGTLASPDMQALLDQITGFQQQITSFEEEIGKKKAAIELLKAEDKAPKETDPAESVEPPAEPAQPAASRFCPQCGTPAGSGAFCAQCGSKLIQ